MHFLIFNGPTPCFKGAKHFDPASSLFAVPGVGRRQQGTNDKILKKSDTLIKSPILGNDVLDVIKRGRESSTTRIGGRVKEARGGGADNRPIGGRNSKEGGEGGKDLDRLLSLSPSGPMAALKSSRLCLSKAWTFKRC